MAERPLYTLYKNLKAQNYDVPNDYNKFESALTRDGKSGADNRHAIYNNLKAQNFDVPDTYERFYSALFEPRSKTSSRAKGGSVPMSAADRARFSAGAAAISASAKQIANNAGRYNRLKQRKQKQQKDFGRVSLGTHMTPFGGDANNVVKDDFAYNPETGKAGAYVTSDNENAYTQSDAEQRQAILDKYGEEWNKAVDMGMVPSELDKADPGLSDTDVAMRQMERRQEWIEENQNRRSNELDESMHLQDSPFVASGGAVAPSSFNTAIGNEANRLSDAEYGAYNTAKAYNQMLRTTLLQELKEQKQRNENAGWWKDKWNDVSNYFGAMFNTMLDPKLYSQGVMDAAIASNLLQVKKGMEDGTIKKGSNAGEAAQVMLSAIQQQQGESAKQQQYGAKAYQYGDVSGRSLKFMADFALSGWRNVMTTGFTKAGEKVGEKMALGALGKWFTKNTGRVLGDMAGSAALAATNQLGSTYNNVIERYVGMNNENGGVTQDKDGDLSFNKGVSLGKAIKDGFGSATIENFSEMFGEYLPGASKLLSKLGLSKVSSFFEKIGNNAYYKWLSNATNKSGIQGVMSEIAEEEFGTALHAAWGDGDGSWSDFNVFTNPDARAKQIDTCLGMFYSVGFMQSPRTAVGAINAVKYFNIKHQVTKADKFGQMMFGDNWDEIKSKIDVTTNADLTKTVLDATRSDSMNAKQKGAVINYAMFLSKLRGYNQASDAKTKDKVEEGETAPTLSNDLDDAYTEGHNADDADKHDIQIQHEDQSKTLAAALGISEQQLSAMSDEELESLTGQDDKLDQAIYDYQLSTARYQGVVDDAQDKVDLAAHQAEQRVNMYTDQSRGSVRNATIKASGGAEDYGVYIISGNIATHDDGSIDVSNSDDMILYFDPTTNSVEHADALMFAELGEELPADEVKAQAVADAKENAIKEVAGIIDGTVEVGSQFSVTDADGTEHTYEVLADNGDGTAMITIDGNVPTELVNGENVQIPYSFEDLQKMKDLEDQKRLEAAKTEREQMEKERDAQETEQTEESQPSFDFNQILNDNGNVVLVDVLGKDGNTKYPGSKLFLIRDSGAKAKVVELKSDGTLVPHAVNKKDVATISTMTLDEYKQAMPSSMIEDNSGENRGEIEEEAPTIEGETAEPAEEADAPESTETTATEQTPNAEQTPAITLEDGTIVPMLEDGNPDFSKLSAAQTAELYDTQFDEDADGIVSGYVSDAKKALDKANNMTVKGKTFVEQKAAKDAKEKAIADAQAAYDSAIAIRDAYNNRQLAKEENTPEGRKSLIEKAKRKFARLKNSEEWSERPGDLWNETVGKLLHRLYDATGIDVFNDTPNTVYEYVAANVGPYSLNYEGNDNSKGVQQETGLSRSDFAKLGWLAAEGKGMTIDAKIHRLWENRPSNLESADTQEIRNALISLITSGQTAFQARDYILNQRIELAESALEEQLRQEEDAAEARRAKEEEEKKNKTGNGLSNESNVQSNESNETSNKKVEEQNKVLGEQLDESDLPFSAKENGTQQTSSERAADVEKNKVDDIKVVDNIVGQKTRKAFERLAKMMGANIQWQYSDKMGNGWIQETKDADGNVHRTIFITLDSSITEGAQFIFGHEMTHQIKNLNPAAYNELNQLVLDTYGSDAFNKAVDETAKRYSDAGFSGRDRDYYAEEVVADAVGEMIRDLNLAHTLAMKMSHPLLAAIHEILQKIKMAFYGTEYSDVTKNIIRSIEQAYVKTANGQVTNTETGEDITFSLRQKPEPKKKGVGYKVFVLKDGKLYPPMVANPDGAATPVGVWLDADAAPIAGESKTGRPQVKQGGKGTQGGSGKLAYRPGWHLGVVPYAIQFNRKDAEGNKTLFPKNFVFAEVEYAADVDYQEEARQEGINPSGKYQHSLAGLKHLPTDGYYMYRTNPNPETDPWVITGAMKVNRILTRAEQAELVKNAGREPQQIQEGDIVTDDVVNSINQEIADAPKFSLKVYHGSGADFTEFDFDHMSEGAGSQAFGWGGYVTSSEEIGKSYAELTRKKPTYVYNGKEMSEDYLRSVLLDKVGIDNANILDDFLYNLEKYGVSEAKSILRKGDYAYFKDLLKGTSGSARSGYQNKVDAAELILALRNIRVKKYKGNLYEVDIPDNNGSNYLDFENPMNEEQINTIRDALVKNGVDVSSWENRGFKLDLPFKDVYAAVLPMMMRCEPKEVSKFLSSLAFTGIKYPAGTIQGGAEEGDTNYVIFKPEDMKITQHTKFSLRLKAAIEETETNPSDAQKESGNYKKGHIKFGGYDYTIENPKGSTRSGKDANGKEWKITMHDTYGYIRGKFGKDGDHLDMFINDKADLDNWNGDVFVVDQVNPDGSFDEHKVMYGYDSMDDAEKAYLANYSKGWQGLGGITGASKEEFDKWLDTSNRKLKPFADYAKVKFSQAQSVDNEEPKTFEEFLNHPSLKFSIKNEEQRKAAENAYEYATKLRPNKYAQYAIVDMSKPSKIPEYYEKKVLADNWRRFYNRAVHNELNDVRKKAWDNYKLFDLDRPFTDQVNEVKDNVPDEFDAPDAATNKDNIKGLDRQVSSAAEPHYSLKDEKTLAGVHNITEEKLRKALKLGGFANPSLAVIDTNKNGHDNFGEISFIAPSALLDKRTGKTAGTWITDAYTQRYPSVEREMSEKGYRKFEDWVDSLDYPSGVKDEIERQAKDALSDNNAPAWELMYLKEKGIDIKEYNSKVDYRWKEIIRNHPTAEDILSSMQNDPELNEKVTSLVKHTIIHPTWEKVSLEVRRKIYEETGNKVSPINPQVRKQTKEIFERDYAPTLLDKDGKPKAEDIKKVIEDIVKEHNDTKKYDFYLSKVKASGYVNKNGLYDDYIRWQEKKLDEFGTKNRIFRGYKNDGTRKYVPETLENVSKVMREKADGQTNGSEYVSFGSFIAKVTSRVDSTEEMRDNKDKLSSNEDKEKFYEKWENVYYDLAKFLYNDVFYGEQRLHDIVLQSDPKKYAKKEYGITLTPTFMKKLDALKNAVQTELKSAYFETKYNRPLRLNEFAAAVVPDNLGEDVRKGIEDAGLPMYNYDPNKEGDRNRAFNEAVNSSDNIRFSLKEEKEKIVADAKANGTYMTAPNGEKTKLDAEQWVTVRTTNFKNWFGDWENDPENASKVVDENGEPMVVYHGTTNDETIKVWNEKAKTYDTSHEPFTVFKRAVDGLSNSGMFFNSSENNAYEYGYNHYAVYLNAKNPLVIDCKGNLYNSIKHEGKTMDTYDWANWAEENGFDGVIFKNIKDGVDYGSMQNTTDDYVVFYSNQIKSSENNNGDFSADNNDIRFSLRNLDQEYLDAVKKGDMEKAQRLVNKAAAVAGYSTDSSYQGTSAFNGSAPWGNGYFLTKEERKEAWNNGEFEGESTLGDYINDDIDGGNLEALTDTASYRAADPMRKEAIDNVRNAIQKKSKFITMYRSVPSDVKEGSFRNGDWITPSRSYAVDNAKLHGWGNDYNIIEQKVPVDDVWFDGNDIAEWGYGIEKDYINDTDFAYKNVKNNRKLLDVVTYNDNGEVIPLSQRFDPSKSDTRFSLRYDQFEHDLNQWKKDNNLPKDAQRPTIPQRNAGESAADFLKRVDEYRKQMALWKTAPTYEQHLLSDDTALGEFNRELQRGSVLKRIAFQDSMLAIRKAQEAIMKEVGVDRLNTAEDAYTAENRSHGKGKNEFEEYNNEFLQPLRKAYHQMKKVLGDSYDNVRLYMMAKHGLERNAQMAFKKSLEADYEDVAQRSAAYKAYKGDMNRITNDSDLEFGRVDFNTWRQRDNALRTKYSPSYMDYRYDENGIAYDYSGLSALFGGSDFEEAAHKLVRDIESSHVAEVQDLWNATNAATKKILRDGYKAGMMSKDTYLYVRDMYSHYIPLRGWDGTTADQVWDYVGGGKGAFNQTLKTAHGRTSIADDPIAYIENMAESGILLNNKNWVKQHLMLLAQNHPTSLLTLSKAWYVKSTDANGNEEWIPATPQITSQMNSNQVKAAIDAFEQKMEQMAQTGDATQQREGLNIAYPQTHSEEREHEVRVMKDGEEYVIYVNGDPQLAQAMNNTRAHRVREIQSGKLDRAAAWLGRKMAAAYTSLSPLFIPSNYFRDLTMTLASTAIREDAKYNYLLRKNLATSWNLGFMLRDYQNGKLRDKVNNGNATPKEQMFYDFMMNGGETGFVSSLDVEDLKKKFKNDLKDLDRWKTNPVKVGHTIMDSIEFLNRMIEDSNRFAVYMTSIQYGRSIDEAVNDAKDVTLNFNRKGTGEYGWQMIRNLYLFINPAVQSLQTLGALAKHHPIKFTAVTASWLTSGVLVPIVNAAMMSMFGGDDDKDKYWQFTKWDRRNNLIMWVPFTHEYVKIPLAQEFRTFYGVGDMIASKLMGGELAEESWNQYAEDLLGQVVDMLPLDPTGYDGNIAVSLMPNAIRPVFELAFNVDFTGKPLFKETEYNKYDPNFTKAYVGTPDWLVRASRMMNSIGNDYPDVQQNSIDAFGDPRYNLNNPAVVDHVLSSYLGGAYTMGSQVLGVLTKSLNDPKEIKVADIPLFSKFVSNPDDRPVTKKQGDEFWDMKENHDRAANTLSKLKKQAKVDGDYSMLERFYDSEEYKQYKQDDVKVKKYEEDKKKERAEESGEEYRPHKLNAEDIYKAHATPKDDFEDLKLKQLYTKLNGFKSAYDLLVDTAHSQSDGYYNTNKAAIDAIDEISLDKQEISELKKGFLDDGKDAYNAEDMKQIRELRKKILAVLEKANKAVVGSQKAKAEK